LTRRTNLPPATATGQKPIVFVVDDDEGMRLALVNLFESVDLTVEVFSSAQELLRKQLPDVPSCLVLDVRLPGLSGFDLQKEFAKANVRVPIIFMTGHGDIPMSVKAMKDGAVDFLTKPFRDQDMLDAVTLAIERDRRRREAETGISALQNLFDNLTAREREIFALVATGLMNKQIAGKIGIAEITTKIHRGRMMKKMGAKSVAELVKMAEALGINRAK
jgi:FixJ family two-component response regulator